MGAIKRLGLLFPLLYVGSTSSAAVACQRDPLLRLARAERDRAVLGWFLVGLFVGEIVGALALGWLLES